MPSFPTNTLSEDHLDGASTRGGNARARTRCTKPLVYSGSLDSYTYQDVTPVIGREFQGLQVVDLLAAHNSDQMIRDLAVTSNPPTYIYAVPKSERPTWCSLRAWCRLPARPACQSRANAGALQENFLPCWQRKYFSYHCCVNRRSGAQY